MSDVAMMCIIFYLVTATTHPIMTGINERLRPWVDGVEGVYYQEEKLLQIRLNVLGEIFLEGDATTREGLYEALYQFYLIHGQDPDYHISFEYPRDLYYEDYILVKDAVIAANSRIRNEAANLKFGYDYISLNLAQRREVQQLYPLRLAESERVWSDEEETNVCDVVVYRP